MTVAHDFNHPACRAERETRNDEQMEVMVREITAIIRHAVERLEFLTGRPVDPATLVPQRL